MEGIQRYDDALSVAGLRTLRRWRTSMARLVSWALSPPLVALAGILAVSDYVGLSESWRWIAALIVLGILAPCAYIIWNVKRGRITDFHMRRREQRKRPMLVMVLCLVCVWLLMLTAEAPRELTVLLTAGIGQIVALLIITASWKISGHTTAISSFATATTIFSHGSLWFVLLLVPIVAWARVQLGRHDALQTLAGACVGIATTGFAIQNLL